MFNRIRYKSLEWLLEYNYWVRQNLNSENTTQNAKTIVSIVNHGLLSYNWCRKTPQDWQENGFEWISINSLEKSSSSISSLHLAGNSSSKKTTKRNELRRTHLNAFKRISLDQWNDSLNSIEHSQHYLKTFVKVSHRIWTLNNSALKHDRKYQSKFSQGLHKNIWAVIVTKGDSNIN